MISVVIPTFNKPEQLRQTLGALVDQLSGTDPACEIVVVDDGSTDPGTRQTIASFAGRLPLVDASSSQNLGRARARNRGWQASRGSWVLFLDDDIRLRPGALRAHLQAQQGDEAVWMGRVITAPEIVDSVLFAYLDSRGLAKLAPHQDPPARYLLTQNVSVPRAALEAVGGFDESFGSYGFEDMDLGFRLEDRAGCRFRALPQAVGEHVHHHTLAQYLAKKRLCGRSSLCRLADLHPARMAEMRLDLLPGIGPGRALGSVLELSWRLRLQDLLEPLIVRWPRGLAAAVAFRALDYLVLAAYRDGLRQRMP